MKRYIINLLLILAIVVSIGTIWIPGNNAIADPGSNPKYHITWSPGKISTAISPGNSWSMDLVFTSDQDLADASLFVTPELQTLVTVAPQSFSYITAETTNTVHIDIAIPTDAIPGDTYNGTVHVKIGHRTYPQPLKVLIYIAAPLDTVTEEAYDETTEISGNAIDEFYELEVTYGADKSREMVVAGLRDQDEVVDAGILNSGDIWVTYKIGLESMICTSPPGMNGAGSIITNNEITETTYPTLISNIIPGNNEAILLSPFYSQPFRPNPTNEIRDTLNGLNFNVEVAYDEEVTIDLIKTLYQYGVIDWSTHGGVWSDNKVILATGEEATFFSFYSHFADIATFRILQVEMRYDFVNKIDKEFWAIRHSFIEHYATQDYPDSIVHTDACEGLANDTMADAFVSSGAYVYLGWDISIYSYIATDVGEALFHYLADGNCVQQAYDLITADNGIKSRFGYYPSNHGDFCLDAIVHFPDPNLEAAIREAIGKPTGNIYQSDLVGLTFLDASKRGINNLTGMEHCTSLRFLNLEENQINNIEALIGMTNMRLLFLCGNQISNIEPLAGMTNLIALVLHQNQISNIEPLTELIEIQQLFLYNNQISNIEPLIGMTNLRDLHLGWNQISNIEPLVGLINLRWLHLGYNQIGNIEPLVGLTNLDDLFLIANQISNIKPLVDNPGIDAGDDVWLQNNPLSPTSIGTYIPQLQARGVIVKY